MSLIGTGVWIGQGTSPSTIILVGFHSRKFNHAHENYSSFDEELLAIKDALEGFRSELSGCIFSILTDHKPLVVFPIQYNWCDRQERSQRLINQFSCRIEYPEGKANVIGDAFSCVFIIPSLVPTPSDFIPSSLDSAVPPHFSKSPKSSSGSFRFNPTPSFSPPNNSAPPVSPRTNYLPAIMAATTTIGSQAKGKSPAALKASPAPPAAPTSLRVTYAQVVHALVTPQLAQHERQVEAVLTRLAETISYQSTLPAYNPNETEPMNAAICRQPHAQKHYPVCNDSTCRYHATSHTHANRMPMHNKCEYCNTSRNHYNSCCNIQYRDHARMESSPDEYLEIC